MAEYSHTSFAQLKSQVAARLNDSNKIFWTDAELGFLCVEALRTFNVASFYHRDKGLFPTVSGQAFYDICSLLDKDGVKILGQTITDRYPVNSLQYSLIEPANDWSSSTSWAGTEMFTMDDLQSAIQRRRNQFLLETAQILTTSKIDVDPPSVGKVSLVDSIQDVRRAAWISLDNDGNESAYTNLWQTDEETLNRQSPSWSYTPDTPQAYSVLLTPQVSLKLAPPPKDKGKLYLSTINSGSDLDVTTGVLLGILDDFTPYIAWGARADLLNKESEARDPARAQYAEGRYREGVELAKIFSTVMNAEINGVPCPTPSIMSLDAQVPGWQKSSGKPDCVGIEGANLVALYKVPDGIYSITLDVVRNAIVPVNDADQIQIGREYLARLIDYICHLALFKCGGAEFTQSMSLYENMFRMCAEYNARLKAESKRFDVLADKTRREARERPYEVAA